MTCNVNNYDQGEARARLKKMSLKSLRVLSTRLETRLAGLEKCVQWPALVQSLSRDIKAVHDEIRFKEDLEAKKESIRSVVEQAALWDPSEGPWKNK